MFASDYDIKGTASGFAISITIHVLVALLIIMWQMKQKRVMAEYTLTEITMMEMMPEEQKPQEIQKPKSVADMFKQLIPLKQTAPQLEVSKPQKLELEKPKLEMQKPQALTLNKMDTKINPAMKAIDLSNEIGAKKLAPAEIKQAELAQQSRQLAEAPKQALSLQNKPAMSSFLPSAKPGISTMAKQPSLKPETVNIEKPTPFVKKSVETGTINIAKKNALLITGQIANRAIMKAVKPPYPRWAQEQNVQAEVSVYMTVRADGSVKENAYVQSGSGYPELDQLALEAAKQFMFAPKPGPEETGVAVFRFMLER